MSDIDRALIVPGETARRIASAIGNYCETRFQTQISPRLDLPWFAEKVQMAIDAEKTEVVSDKTIVAATLPNGTTALYLSGVLLAHTTYYEGMDWRSVVNAMAYKVQNVPLSHDDDMPFLLKEHGIHYREYMPPSTLAELEAYAAAQREKRRLAEIVELRERLAVLEGKQPCVS